MMVRGLFPVLLAAVTAAVYFPGKPAHAAQSEIISEAVAAQHGLVRPWFTQVELDRARGQLDSLTLFDGTLFAKTNRGIIQAIDAETGKTQWTQQVGDPRHPTLTPGAHRDFVAVINGSRLYVLNRYNGDLLLEVPLEGAPGAGPAVSSRRVFVPMESGQVFAYHLKSPKAGEKSDAKRGEVEEETEVSEESRRRGLQLSQHVEQPLACQSYGRANVQPLIGLQTPTEENVIWPTDRGLLNLGRIDAEKTNRLMIKYRLETTDAIVGQPACYPPDPDASGEVGVIVATSRDGFIYAFEEKNGNSLWRFSLGDPIVESPVVIEGRVYVTAQLGGMACIELKTGREIWHAPDLLQFVAVSKNRVYASDRFGRLAVLDAENGTLLDSLSAEKMPVKLMNVDTDRVYLADKTGLVQCLHEIEQTDPIVHDQRRKEAALAGEMPTIKQTGIEEGEKGGKKEKEKASPKTPPKKSDKTSKTEEKDLFAQPDEEK